MTTIHIPAKHEMVSDAQSMTITVAGKPFVAPDLYRRAEWDFSLKEAICGTPDTPRDVRGWHRYFAEQLGCKFNLRFFAANYWLWIGNRMTVRTGNMLRYEGRHWNLYDSQLVSQAHKVLPYINEAERDGLYNLIPIIVAHEAPPQVVRSVIGRGAWRRASNNSVSRNLLIMQALRRCGTKDRASNFVRLLDMPSGVMRGVLHADDDEVIAARIAPRKRPEVFRQTVHLVRDTRRMLRDGFNPQWSYLRMREEHERATRELLRQRYSDKKFAREWTFSDSGYTAVQLVSQADIATEGAIQHHCVASYAGEAARGKYFVFRIEGKERATLGTRNGSVNQVYGACNSPVTEECLAFSHKVAREHVTSLRRAVETAA